MGTSNKYGGAPSRSPLLPSWVGDLGGLPGEPAAPPATPDKDENPAKPQKNEDDKKDPEKKKEVVQEPPLKRFQTARSNFTEFAKSGGRNHAKLGRALSSYVRSGSGGARTAAHRMGSSRKAAARVGGFIRDVQQVGPREALERIKCGDLVGKPANEVMHRLVDAFCPAGGPVDEGIARQAFAETVAQWSEQDLPNIDQLTVDQWQELLVDFVSHSIELKVFSDIGAKGIEMPANAQQALNIQTELSSVIEGCVRNAFGDNAGVFTTLTDPQISNFMESIYERAWGFIEAVGGES